MRTVGIICPNCYEIIQYDSDAETATCKFCKHAIKTKDEGSDIEREGKLKILRKELDVQLEQGFVDYKIADITNRILGLAPKDADAWFYKGMASNKVSTKLACYFNCARYLDISEYDDLYDTMAEDLSSHIYKSCDEDWSPFDAAYIDVMLRSRKAKSQMDDFLLDTIGRLKDIILESEDAYHAKVALDNLMKLSIATLAVYCSLAEQKKVLDKILGYIDAMNDKFKKFVMEERRGYNNKSLTDRLANDKKFLTRIINHIGSTAKRMDEDEDKEYNDFWLEEDITPYVKPLLDSYVLNEVKFDAGIRESMECNKKQVEAIEFYIYKYISRGIEEGNRN